MSVTPPNGIRRALAASGRGASAILAIAASQRLLTFALNAALVRSVSADVLGYAANDMELLLSTIHFLSREGCRLVALRAPLDVFGARQGRSRQQLVNLAWLPVPVGLGLSAIAAAVILMFSSDGGSVHKEERHSTLIYCVAAAVEALSEPAYILCQSMLLYNARARAEIAATLLRCVSTYALVVVAGLGPLAFAIGQLVFATTLALGFSTFLVVHIAAEAKAAAAVAAAAIPNPERGAARDFVAAVKLALPRQLASPPSSASNSVVAWLGAQIGPERVSLLGAFSLQGLVKHALTEGDRLLLTALASRAQRGVYAVVTNYGSLAPRLLFAPLEEAERASVSKLLGGAASDRVQAIGVDVSAAAEGDVTARSTQVAEMPLRRRRGARKSLSARMRASSSAIGAPSMATSVASLSGRKVKPRDELTRAAPRRRSSSRRSSYQGITKRTVAAARASAANEVPAATPAKDESTASVGGQPYRRSSISQAAVLDASPLSPSQLSQPAALALAGSILIATLRLATTAGLIVAALGPPNARAVVGSLLGSRWVTTEAAPALAAYCVYVLFLAINGAAEAFGAAAAGPRAVLYYNGLMACAAITAATVAAVLLPTGGAVALVGANVAAMIIRGGASLMFAARTLRGANPAVNWRAAAPSLAAATALIAAAGATAAVQGATVMTFRDSIRQLTLGGVIAAPAIAFAMWMDISALRRAWRAVRGVEL